MHIRQAQITQPWLLAYSSVCLTTLQLSRHVVLHAMKSTGKLAGTFEQWDHGNPIDIQLIKDMSADLMSAAMRLANIHEFDLENELIRRQKEKNGLSSTD